jgi:isocitrate/isopropylmalate dehydrogenase
MEIEAQIVESAVQGALSNGYRTPDLRGNYSTQAMTEAIINNLEQKKVNMNVDGSEALVNFHN